MLMCQSFIISFAVSSVTNWSVWVLLQLMIKGLFSLNIIALNSLLIKIASFAVCDRANNSVSVLNVVTISCLFALYAISPLNSFIMYLCKLFLLMELSTNNALLAYINNCISFLLSFLLSCSLSLIPLSLSLPFIPSLSPL